MEFGQDALELDLEPLPDDGSELDGGSMLPRYLSPSSAAMFQQCPRKWKHRYVDRLPDPPGIPALVGTFAHRVLELLLCEPKPDRTVVRARELARTAWPEIERHPDFRALGLDAAAARDFRWKGWQAIEGLWRIEDPAIVEVHATERDVRVHLGDVPFRGIVDRVDVEDDGLVVADYKSGKAPSDRYADARLAQVLLYAAAIAESTGSRPARARLLYLDQRIIEVAVTEDNVGAVVETLHATWEALRSACDHDEFEARTGPLCAWCPFIGHCPEGRAEVEVRHLAGRVRADAPALELLAVGA
jgi:putative RecB family exonuclease